MTTLFVMTPRPFKSFCKDTIPAFGLIRCSEIVVPTSLDFPVLKATIPTACPMDELFVNTLTDVPPRGASTCYQGDILQVAYDAADRAVPEIGEPWGVKQGGFKLRKGYGGFVVLRKPLPDDGEYVWVRRMMVHRYQGVLAETLSSVSNAQTAPNAVSFTAWLPKLSDVDATEVPNDPLDFQNATAPTTDGGVPTFTIADVVCRDKNASAISGTFAMIEWLNGEWTFYYIGC